MSDSRSKAKPGRSQWKQSGANPYGLGLTNPDHWSKLKLSAKSGSGTAQGFTMLKVCVSSSKKKNILDISTPFGWPSFHWDEGALQSGVLVIDPCQDPGRLINTRWGHAPNPVPTKGSLLDHLKGHLLTEMVCPTPKDCGNYHDQLYWRHIRWAKAASPLSRIWRNISSDDRRFTSRDLQ